jgi:hypothetical protein
MRDEPVAGLPAVFCISLQMHREVFLLVKEPPGDNGIGEEDEDERPSGMDPRRAMEMTEL